MLPSIFRDNFMDNFFDDFFMPTRMPAMPRPRRVAPALMRTDIKENENGYMLDVDIPGFKKEEVKAQLKDGYLTISASKNAANDVDDENGKYIRRERFAQNCTRSFYVGDELTEEDIKAKFEDGILHLELPKKETEKLEAPKYIEIA